MTVSSEQRGGLSRAVSRLRVLFEDDFAALLEGTFGIHVSGRRAGEIEDPDALSLSAHELSARAELVGVVEYLQEEGLGPVEAVERLLREATFTTVNRLLAVRVAEAIGVLPLSLSEGRSSSGFVETLEVFPLLRDADASGGYWSYLQVCGDELSHAVPRLFDRRHPLSVLVPSSETLDAAIEVLADPGLVGVWVEPETLGWSYQFFNTQEERVEAKTQDDPHALAVRTQFFTPSYVVDFLVENTLGRRLRESGSELKLPLLIGEIEEGAPPLNLDDVSVLDPAVGSGHFLLGAYDLLERAWGEQGIKPAEAASRILGSLFGVDIDARAAQVAQAVLYLRARRSAPVGVLDPPRIVTARALPKDPDVWDEVIHDVPPFVRDVVQGLREVLEQAPVLGSLLKPEEYLREAIGERLVTPRLGDEALGSFEDVENRVLDAARRVAAETTSSPAERLFAADATDALRFAEIVTRRYDTVLMNPPFGNSLGSAAPWLKKAYGNHATELYSAFAQAGIDLINPDGYMGALAARPGFFLRTFETWRSEFVIPRLVAVADLGFGAVEDAVIEIIAYACASSPSDGSATYLRLLNERDKVYAMSNPKPIDIFEMSPVEFERIPGTPLAYWVSPTLRDLFDLPRFGDSVDVQFGASSKSDFRFLRLWWEVAPGAIGRRARWAPFAKGGEYAPYYADLHLVIDWEDDARRIAESVTSRYAYLDGNAEWVLHRQSRHFDAGLTYTRFTTSDFGPRVLPAGSVFSDQGLGIFAGDDRSELLGILGYLNTRVARYLLDLQLAAGEGTQAGTPGRKYEIAKVQTLPLVIPDGVAEEVGRLVSYHRAPLTADETSHSFISGSDSPRLDSVPSATEALEASLRVDLEVLERLSLTDEARRALRAERGLHPVEYAKSNGLSTPDLERLWMLSLTDLAKEAVDRRGGARHLAVQSYWVDRRLELVCHILEAHPSSVLQAVSELGLPQSATSPPLDVSYLIGGGFGRWDVRIGRDPGLAVPLGDPFDPLPVCPPGMLTGEDGLSVTRAPDGYPISLPPDRVLHDDPGHEWDVVSQMESVAESLFDDPDDELREALSYLKAKDLRSYLRSKFFSQHLSRYSKSRRKAPIYWYLAVPSKEWGLWVYAPWLSREQLFAIARAAQEKMRRLADEASQLRRDVEAGGGRADRERLEAVEALMEEVEEFRRAADSVAQSGWEPDLNDGIILNAAPLQELFADKKWRTDVEKHRKKMINGDYSWATVQTAYYDRIES